MSAKLPYLGYDKDPDDWSDVNIVAENIHRLRRQIAIHAYIYYELDENCISDLRYEELVKRLHSLQKRFPKIASSVSFMRKFFMDESFHSTSFHISDAVKRIKTWPYSGVRNRAYHLVRIHKERS